MNNKFDATVVQVLKAVMDKQYLGSHVVLTAEKPYAAFGVTHKPCQEMKVKMTTDGKLCFLVKCDKTGEITGYIGKIYTVVTRDKNRKLFDEYAKKYSAYYYDYQQCNTIYLVEKPEVVSQEKVERLLNGLPYLNKKKKFSLFDFFKNRAAQLYLLKNVA